WISSSSVHDSLGEAAAHQGRPAPKCCEAGEAMMQTRSMLGAMALALLAASVGTAWGEANELRVSRGFGMHYLALYIMDKQKVVEKYAAAAGLGDVKVSYRVLDGGNVINDAMLSGALDIASGGVPGFVTLWDKTRNIPQAEVRGLTGAGAGSVWL